jgi:hypothetical protein
VSAATVRGCTLETVERFGCRLRGLWIVARVTVPYAYGALGVQAVCSTLTFSSVLICSRMTNFWTLPVTVSGNSLTNRK